MLIFLGETNFFTVSEPQQPTKPTSQWLWEFNPHSSPKVFRESRFSENSNMYTRTKVVYVSLWKTSARKNQLLCGARTNKTNFSETFSFQPTIQVKHVQHKSPKSIKSWFYWFCWFGICEKVGFHCIKPKNQQDRVATQCSCLIEHWFILVCWFYLGKPTFLQCPSQNNQQNQLPSDFESLTGTPAQRCFVSPASQKTATCTLELRILYVQLWKCWLSLGKTNFCVVPEPIKPIKQTFQRLSVFSPPSTSNASSVNPKSLQQVCFICVFGLGCVHKLVFSICESRISENTTSKRLWAFSPPSSSNMSTINPQSL